MQVLNISISIRLKMKNDRRIQKAKCIKFWDLISNCYNLFVGEDILLIVCLRLNPYVSGSLKAKNANIL